MNYGLIFIEWRLIISGGAKGLSFYNVKAIRQTWERLRCGMAATRWRRRRNAILRVCFQTAGAVGRIIRRGSEIGLERGKEQMTICEVNAYPDSGVLLI